MSTDFVWLDEISRNNQKKKKLIKKGEEDNPHEIITLSQQRPKELYSGLTANTK